MKLSILSVLITCIITAAESQVIFEESFSSDQIQHLVISNLSGGVEVNSGLNSKIKVDGRSTTGSLPDGFSIDYKQDGNYLMIYIRTKCTKPKDEITFDVEHPNRFDNNINDCNCNNNFDDLPIVNFKVEAPKNIHLYVSTILNGDVRVKNMSGKTYANNINGGIDLIQIQDLKQAKTINGDINIDFQSRPLINCEFSTINGEIRVKVPGDIRSTASFKSFQGHFYTDLDAVTVLPGSVIVETDNEDFKYKVEHRRRMEINGGGVLFDFETFNGDVYLTKLD